MTIPTNKALATITDTACTIHNDQDAASRVCPHCGEEDCADHCPASDDGEHHAEPNGDSWMDYYDDTTMAFDVPMICEACGAEGHSIAVVDAEALLKDVRWDAAGSE